MVRNWPIITEQDKARVLEVLDEGNLWRGNGNYLFELEEKFAEMHGVSHALAVTNGTHALEIALEAVGIGYGDEVLIPAYTFIATATAVLMRNAIPIPVEVDAQTWCMDPKRIEEMVTERTKAIIPVHISGHACDMDPIMEVANRYGLNVIEDCAHAHGSSYQGRMLGSIGHFGTFSFQAVKTMTAGEGGMLITKDAEIWRTAYSFFNCGRQPDGPSYLHTSLASNYRMSEMQAALLVGQLNRLDAQIEQRTDQVQALNELLRDVNGLIPQGRASYVTKQGYSMYMFRYKSEAFGGMSRQSFIEELNRLGYPAFRTYPVFYTTELFDALYERYPHMGILEHKPDYSNYHFPISHEIADEVVWLPHYFLFSPREELVRFQQDLLYIQAHHGSKTTA